jgi:hypothetical protein
VLRPADWIPWRTSVKSWGSSATGAGFAEICPRCRPRNAARVQSAMTDVELASFPCRLRPPRRRTCVTRANVCGRRPCPGHGRSASGRELGPQSCQLAPACAAPRFFAVNDSRPRLAVGSLALGAQQIGRARRESGSRAPGVKRWMSSFDVVVRRHRLPGIARDPATRRALRRGRCDRRARGAPRPAAQPLFLKDLRLARLHGADAGRVLRVWST